MPDSVGSSKVVVLSTARQAAELTDTTGAMCTLWRQRHRRLLQRAQESVWSQAYSWPNAGTSLDAAIWTQAAGADYAFVGGGTTSNECGHSPARRGSTSGFSSLAGGTSGYAIYKNGLPATAEGYYAQVRRRATYSSTTNSIRVKRDTRMLATAGIVIPNPKVSPRRSRSGHMSSTCGPPPCRRSPASSSPATRSLCS
ncbi:MAG: hypothetical protein ACLT1A_04650 [Dysosmobacter sp.]